MASEPITPRPRVWLTLLLDGGQRESLSLDAAHPLLDVLMQVLRKESAPLLLEIPLREGAALLTVPSSRIIGVLTEPPLPLSLPAQKPAPVVSGRVGVPAPAGALPGVVPVRAAQIANVLTAEQHRELLAYVEKREKDFVASGTSTKMDNYRASTLLYEFQPFQDLLMARVRHLLPKALGILGMDEFEVANIEAQLTTHNDNNYYKVHNDNGSEDTATRVLTFVYYFNRSPKAYTGGELVIFDRLIENGYQYAAESSKTVQPLDNSLVVFNSGEMHEVRRVDCPSLAFMDGRFTINGWVRRKAAA